MTPGGSILGAQTAAQVLYRDGRRYSNISTEAYRELMKQTPDSAYALALSAEEKAKERQYSEALHDYEQALQRMPALRGVHAEVGEIDTVLGKKDEAEAAYDSERKLGPPDCSAHRPMCDFFARRFRSVLEETNATSNPEDLYWRTKAAKELAVESFAGLSKYPNSNEYREFRGELLFLTEDYKGVLPELERLQKADPQSAKLNFFVGDGMFETQRIEEAVPYLEAALKLDPKLRPADVSLGLCYMRLGEPDKAIPHLEKGLLLDRDGTLYYQLARAYQETGQPERAKEMMAKFEQLRQRSGAIEQAQ